jgi:hypothetical protein
MMAHHFNFTLLYLLEKPPSIIKNSLRMHPLKRTVSISLDAGDPPPSAKHHSLSRHNTAHESTSHESTSKKPKAAMGGVDEVYDPAGTFSGKQ